MLDRFAVQQLLRAGLTARAVARQAGISLRSVRRIARQAPITSLDVPSVAVGQRVGRPRVTDDVRAFVRDVLTTEPELPIGEVWRGVREAGTPLGLSTTLVRTKPLQAFASGSVCPVPGLSTALIMPVAGSSPAPAIQVEATVPRAARFVVSDHRGHPCGVRTLARAVVADRTSAALRPAFPR